MRVNISDLLGLIRLGDWEGETDWETGERRQTGRLGRGDRWGDWGNGKRTEGRGGGERRGRGREEGEEEERRGERRGEGGEGDALTNGTRTALTKCEVVLRQ